MAGPPRAGRCRPPSSSEAVRRSLATRHKEELADLRRRHLQELDAQQRQVAGQQHHAYPTGITPFDTYRGSTIITQSTSTTVARESVTPQARGSLGTTVTEAPTESDRTFSTVDEYPDHFKVRIPAGTEIIDLTNEPDDEEEHRKRLAAIHERFKSSGIARQAKESSQFGQVKEPQSAPTVQKKPSPFEPSLRPSPFRNAAFQLSKELPPQTQTKKRKRFLVADKQTSLTPHQICEQQYNRLSTLRKPGLHRSPSIPLLERQKRSDALMQSILTNGSTNRHNVLDDDDVEMKDTDHSVVEDARAHIDAPQAHLRSPRQNGVRDCSSVVEVEKSEKDGREQLNVNIQLSSTKNREALKPIFDTRRKSNYQASRQRKHGEATILREYEKARRSLQLRSAFNDLAEESESEPETPPTPCPAKEPDITFKVPPLPARLNVKPSTRAPSNQCPTNNRHIHDDSEDEDYDPGRGTPDPDQVWNINRLNGIKNISPPKHRNFSANSRAASVNTTASLGPACGKPFTLSLPSKRRQLPRGVRTSLASSPTASELGSPARKRRRFTVDVDESDEDFEPDKAQSSNKEIVPTFVRPKVIPKPKLKGYGVGVSNENGASHIAASNVPQSPQNATADYSEPRTPRTSCADPRTPKAPKPARYADIQGLNSPVSPSPAETSPFMSTAMMIRQKRASRLEAEQRVKAFVAEEAAMAAKSEEQHMRECEALLPPSRPRKKEAIIQNVETGVRSLSIAPSIADDCAPQDWFADHPNGDRFLAKMLEQEKLEKGGENSIGVDMEHDRDEVEYATG